MDDILKMDVGYMITDLRKTFSDKEEFKMFAEVLQESLGEFLMDIYASTEENLTVEDLLLRLKKIIERRFDEV